MLLALILAGLGLGGLLVLARLAREHPTSTPRHLPEPPDDASPALAYGLAHEGGDSTDTVLATLLDLVDRGYYKATQANTEDEKLDLALAVAAEAPQVQQLEPHEKEVLDFFDELLEGDTVPMSEMRDRIPEHSATWRVSWESMTSALNSVDEGQLAWDRNLNGAKWLLILGLVIGFARDRRLRRRGQRALPRARRDRPADRDRARGLSAGSRLKRLEPEYGERSAKWRAFERWTKDFPQPQGRSPGDARALEADPGLRRRLRHRRAHDRVGPHSRRR